MKLFLALLFVAVAAGSELSAAVDSIIQETHSHIKNELEFPPLSYEAIKWDEGYTKYEITGKLDASVGKVTLGEFARRQDPVLYGTPKDGVIETRFIIKDAKVTYDKFSALDLITGDKSEGKLTVTFGSTEMYSLINLKTEGNTCKSSLSTITPIEIGEAVAQFEPESKLTKNLWTEAMRSLNYPMNATIVQVGWPELAKVVAKSNLCTVLIH